jgi:predicted phage terminase large subunit-like protein
MVAGTVMTFDLVKTAEPIFETENIQPKEVTERDAKWWLVREMMSARIRESFIRFRHHVHPHLIPCWWQHYAGRKLQQFYNDYLAGLRPKLIILAPPQHGKTELIIDFMGYMLGMQPASRIIFTSYSNDLCVRTNLAMQRLLFDERYALPFERTFRSIGYGANRGTGSNHVRTLRNLSVIELPGLGGSFRNTTVQGQITGQGLNLGVVDDPIKGRQAATSPTVRQATWNWFTDDFFSRFSDNAAMLMILTRWHIDDPAGRWIEAFPDTEILRFPAIAAEDDWSVLEGYRKPGGALFPKLKTREFLLERKQLYTNASWEALYQQSPIAAGGEMFPIERFRVVSSFDRSKVNRSVRYVDKAGTEDGGAYTAASLVHHMKDGTTIVEDVARGQWSAHERETRLLQIAAADKAACRRYSIWFEQEPGSGGKESAESSIKRFKGYDVHADKVTGSKEVRAEPYAAQVQAGNVTLIASAWNRQFLDEHEQFPYGKYADQVDATAGAFNKLAASLSGYDRTLDWVG